MRNIAAVRAAAMLLREMSIDSDDFDTDNPMVPRAIVMLQLADALDWAMGVEGNLFGVFVEECAAAENRSARPN